MSLTAEAEKSEAASPYSGEDRRKGDKTARAIYELQRGHKEISSRLNDGDTRMGNLEEAVKRNTEITEKIKGDTGEIVDFFQSVKGAVKVADMIGKLAKPLTYIIMFVTAIAGAWTAIKAGGGITNGH